MERAFTLEAEDGHYIHGVLNSRTGNGCVAVFVHGLTGDKDYHLYHRAARIFPKIGVDVFRYDMFSNQERGRTLTDCSLSLFASDLTKVAHFLADKYEEIHIIGHSIGGGIAMMADPQSITSLTLWDTGLQTDPAAPSPFEYQEGLGCFIARMKIEYLLSSDLVEQRTNLNADVVRNVCRPMLLVFAGQTGIENSWHTVFPQISVPYTVQRIEGAGHGFSEWGVDEQLFQITLGWILKQQNEVGLYGT